MRMVPNRPDPLIERDHFMQTLADLKAHSRFAELREKVETAGSDHTDVFGGTYQGGYYTQQNPDEFAALACLLLDRGPIDLYGEIGVAAGGTTRLMHELVGFNDGVLIDNGAHPNHKHFTHNVAKLPCHFIQGDSHAAYVFDTLRNYLSAGVKFDVVFIDGDHSYEGVKQDIELVLPYCTPDTLLIFHDTVACDGVGRAFGELLHPVANFISEDKHLGIGVARVGVNHAVQERSAASVHARQSPGDRPGIRVGDTEERQAA